MMKYELYPDIVLSHHSPDSSPSLQGAGAQTISSSSKCCCQLFSFDTSKERRCCNIRGGSDEGHLLLHCKILKQNIIKSLLRIIFIFLPHSALEVVVVVAVQPAGLDGASSFLSNGGSAPISDNLRNF